MDFCFRFGVTWGRENGPVVQVKKRRKGKYTHSHIRVHRLCTAQIQGPIHMDCDVICKMVFATL